MKAFLDAHHSEETILQYERVFGRHFISPGGRESAECLIKKLQLQSDQLVLDVGCGLGGSVFLMAEVRIRIAFVLNITRDISSRSVANYAKNTILNFSAMESDLLASIYPLK